MRHHILVLRFLLIIVILCFSFTGAFGKEHNGTGAFLNPPLYFVKNDGQKDASVLYYEQGPGHLTSFTREGILISLSGLAKIKDKSPALVTLTPVNGSLHTIEALHAKEGKVNYLTGKDPQKWKRNIPTYGVILYRNIYPGIDLKFYGAGNRLEYDLIVAPHADPSSIRLVYNGIEGLSLTPAGDLEIFLKESSFFQTKPHVYQIIDGVKREIEGKFNLVGVTTYGFNLESYDKGHPLIIDPVLVYSTYLGGSSDDYANAIAVDSSGNVYVAGGTQSADFPTGEHLQGTNSGGFTDAFITKLDPSGALIYTTYLGGSSEDEARAIAVDSSGNVYVAGTTQSSDFPTQNPYQGAKAGNYNAFITKLDSSGSGLVYSTYLGGGYIDYANAIAVDSAGNAYIAGHARSPDFPIKNPYQGVHGGGVYDGFVAKFDPIGDLDYSTFLGGDGWDEARSIAVDSSGNAYVAGTTQSSNFPTQNPYQDVHGGYSDAFVAKLGPSGSALVYSTFLGGDACDDAFAIAVDPSGNAYVAGETRSTNFPIENPYRGTAPYGKNAFVAKLKPLGTDLVYSTYLGGSSDDYANAIAVDSSGNVYVAGYTESPDFPTRNPYQASHGGGQDAFIAKLDPSGSALVYSTFLGGSGHDGARAIAIDSFGNPYVAGYTESTDFPTHNPIQETHMGYRDAFVAKVTIPWFDLTVVKAGSGTGEITSDPASITCGSSCVEGYQEGQSVTLTALADPGSVFLGWSGGGCSGVGTCIVVMSEDITVTGTFSLVLSVDQGTIGTQITLAGSGFGSKRGKVSVGGKKAKIIGWTDSAITYEIRKPLPPNPYDTIVKPKEPKGVAPINYGGAFTMMAPHIISVEPNSGVTEDVIVISGNFFGSRKPKIYLNEKRCKVVSWTMDSITGESEVSFVVPKQLLSGIYNVKIVNMVNSDALIAAFTVD